MGNMDAGMVETIFYQLLIVCVIGLIFTIEGSEGTSISPSLVDFLPLTPPDGMHAPVEQIGSFNSVTRSSKSHPNGSSLNPPVAPSPVDSNSPTKGLVPSASPNVSSSPPNITSPPPAVSGGTIPSISPSSSSASPSHTTAPPPVISQGPALPLPPTAPEARAPVHTIAPPPTFSQGPALPVAPIPPEAKPVPITPAASPSDNLPPSSSVSQPSTPPSPTPNSDQNNTSSHGATVAGAVSPVAPPPEKPEKIAPAVHQIAAPLMLPSSPGGSPPSLLPNVPRLPGESPSQLPGPNITLPPNSAPPKSIDPKPSATPLAAPPPAQPSVNHSPTNGSSAIAPSTHKSTRHSDAPVPSLSSTESPPSKVGDSPASTPPISPHKQTHSRDKVNDPAPAPSY